MFNFIFTGTFIVCITNLAYSQIGTKIPLNRRTNWEMVGYQQSPKDNLPKNSDYAKIINADPPTGNYVEDYTSITTAIREASALSSENYRVLVQLQSGEYILDEEVRLGPENNYVTIRGKGSQFTTIRRRLPLTGKNSTINIFGNQLNTKIGIVSYDVSQKKIVTDIPVPDFEPGSFIELRIPNSDKWCVEYRSSCVPDFLGQIVQIQNIEGNAVYLKDDFEIFWNIIKDDSEKDNLYFEPLRPAIEIGIENLELTMGKIPLKDVYSPEYINNEIAHANISFRYAANCWIKGIKSSFTKNVHCAITQSYSIEVRNSYFNDAQYHGINGHGYGVIIQSRSSNCLIENNVFQRLRHSIVLAHSASRNVFGYNYSFESKKEDENGNKGRDPRVYESFNDISIHGFFPFANLFEGNRVDEALADKWHSANGPFNTFFRNYVYYKQIKLESTDHSNIIGNKSFLMTDSERTTLDLYGIISGAEMPHYFAFSGSDTRLGDISYYHRERPDFLSRDFSWPPIGPKTYVSNDNISQTIPARENFISKGYCESTFVDCKTIIYSNNLLSATVSDWAYTRHFFGGTFFMEDYLSISGHRQVNLIACESIHLKPGFQGSPIEDEDMRFNICLPNVNHHTASRVGSLKTHNTSTEGVLYDLGITVYPNPSTGVYHIKYHLKDKKKPLIVSLLSYDGRQLFLAEPKNDQLTIDISDQINGLYLLKLTVGSKTEIIKLLKL